MFNNCALDKSYPFVVILLLINCFYIVYRSNQPILFAKTAVRSASLKEATNDTGLLNTDKMRTK